MLNPSTIMTLTTITEWISLLFAHKYKKSC